ncbi:hypothetical protein HRbin14_02312 [bacterium HR14]|nr:hypothetical protein HRbin14_02312 [bacterium HR14]
MTALTSGVIDIAWHGEHLAPVLTCQSGGNQRAALLARFNHQCAQRPARNQPIAHRKPPRIRGTEVAELRDHRPTCFGNLREQAQVFSRIRLAQPAAEDCNRAPAAFQRGAVCDGIYAECATADNRQSRLAQVAREPLRYHPPICRRMACAHHRNPEAVALLNRAPHKQRGRRVGNLAQGVGILRIVLGYQAHGSLLQRLWNRYGSVRGALDRHNIGFPNARHTA